MTQPIARPLRICFDLDGTLCYQPVGSRGYIDAKPFPGSAQLLASLKDKEIIIIINTARGMGSSNGNLGLAQATIAKLTLEQLSRWNFKYDEIYFGKPSADFYIDDKAVQAIDINTFVKDLLVEGGGNGRKQTNRGPDLTGDPTPLRKDRPCKRRCCRVENNCTRDESNC